MPEFESVKVAVEDGIGRLTLDRPGSLNAFNEKMTSEIQSVLKGFSADTKVRCVAITGSGRAFSAGQDLKEVGPGTSFADSLKRRYNPIIRLITGMEKPVIALVNGVAAGAGMSLALACDFKVMSSSAKLIQAFVKIGLVPDSGSSFFLPRLVGYAKAFELAALGSEVSAEEALRLGIVNRVFPDETFAEESGKILTHFASGPTEAYSLIKRMLKHSSKSSLEESLEYEAYMQEIAGRTEDAREATKAFVDKRPPSYKGK
jgi:2-(1,2-epoxy-1,2-dihydrophenyl)acetyl-CoA isomerase